MHGSVCLRGAAAVVAALLLAGCGRSKALNGRGPPLPTTAQVVAAFARSGVPLMHMGTIDGVADYVNADLFQHAPSSPWLEVEVFPSVAEADAVRAQGGNISNNRGRFVRPIAVIRTVVVTRFSNATPKERVRTARAIVILRQEK